MKKIILLVLLFSSCTATKNLISPPLKMIIEDAKDISDQPILYYQGDYLDTKKDNPYFRKPTPLYEVQSDANKGYLMLGQKEEVRKMLEHQKVELIFAKRKFAKPSKRVEGGVIYELIEMKQLFENKKTLIKT